MNTNTRTTSRESWASLAAYYGWAARHTSPFLKPAGVSPLTGEAWANFDWPAAARLERASYIAKAREAYAIARSFGPVPLP
jgi:hypothetical protein